MKVEDLMTKDVRSCTPEEGLDRAAQLMWEQDCGCVPVVASDGTGQVVGMITDRDLCMAAYTQGRLLRDIRVADAMAARVVSCAPEISIGQAEALMADARVRRLPVVDDAGQLLGIVSMADIAREAERERGAGGKKRKQIKSDEVLQTLAAICQPARRETTV